MRTLCIGLVGASPAWPGDDAGRLDAPLGEPDGDAADLLERPADEAGRGRASLSSVFGGGGWLACWRITASMAKASIASETCRCQPCQLRVSLVSGPSSFLAVSKPSSLAQRRPSASTRAAISVPAGHQVEKKASS